MAENNRKKSDNLESKYIPETTGSLSDGVIDCSSNFCLRQKNEILTTWLIVFQVGKQAVLR